ncbi:ABC transporter permease subunit [Oceanispirochaeta crateris]|uniref:ABC transporter permease subunit n=1 Tax=Oceanispirochaeta crateris TaxID=2518645 RepID=A0A5C1QIP1_9SPIO|nr:ABC transporter permease subunit [Oceanispirochaeta crateris]QEN06900.1 ABC transporter permease subunit [Oceanispirochaeta crateris]
MKKLKPALTGVLLVLLMALLWEGLYYSGLFHPLVFPSLQDILKTTARDFLSGELTLSIVTSILLILFSFIPAVLVALILTALGLHSAILRSGIQTLSNLAHPLPGVALLPILILWTGLGQHIILLVVIHSVLWPLVINLQSGIDETPELWLNLGRNNCLSRKEVFLTILLPGSYPYLLAGLKIGWARAWRAVISSEMIFGTISGGGGLGWYIFNKRIFMDSPGMFAGIIVLMILGVLVDQVLFSPLEKGMNRRRGKSV